LGWGWHGEEAANYKQQRKYLEFPNPVLEWQKTTNSISRTAVYLMNQ
jgi:hypothetical protein